MPAGIQVFNDSGIVQIDGTYSNLQLIAKGTTTTTMQLLQYNTQPNGTYYYTTPVAFVSFVANSPVFAVGGPVAASVISTSVSGSTWTVGVVTPAGTASFDWYVFDQAATVGSNVGFQVFNDSGVLVFDAQAKYLKVLDNILDLVPTTTQSGVNGYTYPFTYTYSHPGKTCAVASPLTPISSGTTRWPSGTNTVPQNPNCRGYGFGGWSGGDGAAYFDFIHTILSYQGFYDSAAVNQSFPYSSSYDDASFIFGERQFGGLIIDVTNY